ncbi:SulP family inorganic anion transporter [Asanoa sp. WMMD1127]|uniref:bifunctional SulP family inorganic anion transporter/carbonic anhydrase n=1 Tax=Asanoa sp. WMMD1127 TaxID=3016107 RepID=UPI002416930E|nr:SulP family inorganic anion transporter [Asanoa sp. WMMD1127]MDG4825260.1 SulP family inorganic anion transporter [Asanoa sp. WMMD1127]
MIRSALRHDVPASVVVFLIAIPLSLGIAAASGAPLFAGLIAAVVGGVVAGAISGAPLQVSGPAAGLTVIVAGTVAEFGWAGTVAVVALAGALQVGLGLSRLGRAALSLSPAVVHGMLAGIGVVIVIGQVHVVLGGAALSSPLANLRDLPRQALGHHDASVLIGVLTMVVLVVWPRLVKTSLLPAALVAVAAATALSTVAYLDLPRVTLPDAPLSQLTLPRWPDAPLTEVAMAVVTIALVASVESLLSAVAVDKLHDGTRANLDQELVAQGTANMVSGALGGLPVTGVIVRSSANVAAGARSRASAVLHGLWIAVFALAFTDVLELIPMSALAAVLVVVGVRLVSLAHLRTYARHRELPVYLVTAVGVVVTDLMVGVAAGIGVAVVLTLFRLARCDIRRAEREPGQWAVTITGTLAFVAAGRLARELSAVPPGQTVELDLHLDYLDHGAFEAIEDWRQAYERGGGEVRIHEVQRGWLHRAHSGRLGAGKSTPPHLPRFIASWSQWQAVHAAGLSPADRPVRAMAAGIDEFQRSVAPLVRPHLADLAAKGQRPQQLFITCADSRVVPNLITASGPGDLFCVRNIGNIVPPHGAGDHSVGAAVEYAVDVLGIATITVCGHSACGAVRALMADSTEPDAALGQWLRHAGHVAVAGDEQEHCLANIRRQLDHLRTYPSVRRASAAGRLRLVGMYFDIAKADMHVVTDAAHDEGGRPFVGA